MIKFFQHSYLLMLLLFSVQVSADESDDLTDYKFSIYLEHVSIEVDKEIDTVHLFLEAPNIPIGGFDFKVRLSSSWLEIIDVKKGDFYEECKWEFFSAKNISKNSNAENNSTWHIISLAEMIPDSVQPVCFEADKVVSLAKLIVQKIPMTKMHPENIPIHFYWEDCSDNSISGKGGNQLFFSDKVIDYTADTVIVKDNQFPTIFGTPQNCIRVGAVNAPTRAIEFHHGVIVVDVFDEIDSLTSGK